MRLFDDVTRNEMGPQKRTQTLFGYYNLSAEPFVENMRELLQGWFDGFPDKGKKELISRIRSGNRNFHSAIWELYLHELLRQLGFNVSLHPQLPTSNQTHPDFLTEKDGQNLFYLEATLALPSQEKAGTQARIDKLYDTLDDIDSPTFFIGVVQIQGTPSTAPPGKRLGTDLRKWLSTLDPDTVAQQHEQGGLEALPFYNWSYESWQVKFRAIPKSSRLRCKPGVRTIGVQSTGLSIVNTHSSIRSSLVGKTKYGHLDLPLIVAVNCLFDFVDDMSITDALFGEKNVTLIHQEDGSTEPHLGRNPNGVWFGPKGPQNTRISAVLFARSLKVWNIGKITPMLVHNPWAAQPFDNSLWPLPQLVPNASKSKLIPYAGKSLGEILGIPNSWPEQK